jgi:hypothetical protein
MRRLHLIGNRNQFVFHKARTSFRAFFLVFAESESNKWSDIA